MTKLDELKAAAEDLQSDGFGTLHVPIDTILKLIAVVEAAQSLTDPEGNLPCIPEGPERRELEATLKEIEP